MSNLQQDIKSGKIDGSANKEIYEICLNDNLQNIFWESKEQKEFSLNDQIYDVVSRSTVNGKTMLYCYSDKDEQHLINDYNSLTKHNSATGKKLKDIDNLITLFFENKKDDFFLILKKNNSFSHLISYFPSGDLKDIFSPPRLNAAFSSAHFIVPV
jgi:hypothetical protein